MFSCVIFAAALLPKQNLFFFQSENLGSIKELERKKNIILENNCSMKQQK